MNPSKAKLREVMFDLSVQQQIEGYEKNKTKDEVREDYVNGKDGKAHS